ncbi:hypothetical protein BJX61DRAFT_212882 [Aspergillus egyptiacus]|nr:hypothetical protein BJX61DRAFT_212882 [Aspergillus egyptiacus]
MSREYQVFSLISPCRGRPTIFPWPSGDSMESSTLSQIALLCREDVAALLAATRTHDRSWVTDLLPEKDVIQIQERYEQWAGNLGAFQPSRSALSLDHRLRDSSQVRNLVHSTLQDLHISIQTGT